MSDPTARADQQATELRQWYEANRETWWQRFRRNRETADSFMYRMIEAVEHITRKS
ncbi:MAG: hypothetical protein FD152_536 [Xanthobacteraceae bacterium]|nr:MAG: hypothetical protein FD152_536 [Xanthobacteraceae bacterium]